MLLCSLTVPTHPHRLNPTPSEEHRLRISHHAETLQPTAMTLYSGCHGTIAQNTCGKHQCPKQVPAAGACLELVDLGLAASIVDVRRRLPGALAVWEPPPLHQGATKPNQAINPP